MQRTHIHFRDISSAGLCISMSRNEPPPFMSLWWRRRSFLRNLNVLKCNMSSMSNYMKRNIHTIYDIACMSKDNFMLLPRSSSFLLFHHIYVRNIITWEFYGENLEGFNKDLILFSGLTRLGKLHMLIFTVLKTFDI